MSLQLDPHDIRAAQKTPDRALIAVEQPPPSWLAQQQQGRRGPLLAFVIRSFLAVPALLAFILCLGVWQHTAPDGWRISQLIGAFKGDEEAAKIAASLEAKKQENAALLEEQSRMQREVIAAQANAQEIVHAAQSQAQQEIQAMQGRVQVAAAAYQTLFERANQLAALYAQTTQAFVSLRAEVTRGNQGGSTAVATIADLTKGFAMFTGNSTLYEQADAVRRTTTEGQLRELDAVMARAVPQMDARSFVAQGLPDPAQLAAGLAFAPQVERPARITVGDRPPMPLNPYRRNEPRR